MNKDLLLYEKSRAGRRTLRLGALDVPEADLSALPADRVLCIYGEKDLQSACPTLEGSGAKVIKTGGGHHFDGDYPALARHVLDGS